MKIKAATNALLLMAEDRRSLWTFGDIYFHNLIRQYDSPQKNTLCYILSPLKNRIKMIIIL